MQPHLQMEAYREDTGRIVADIFCTMLGLDISPTEAEWPPEAGLITVAVYYAGVWQGALLMECTRQQAFQFTARLMAIQPPSSVDADVRDAMGELANMIAGNLKPVLPHGVCLSMPSVVEGSDYSLWVCGGNLASRQAFATKAGVLWVTLVEMLKKS